MNLKNTYKIAVRNTRYYRRLTLGTSLLTAACFLALASFRLYFADANDYMVSVWSKRLMFGDIVLDKVPGAHADERPLNTDEQAATEAILGTLAAQVETSARFLNAQGLVLSGRKRLPFFGKGYDVAPATKMRGKAWAWDAVAGRPLDAARGDGQAEIGRGLAVRLGCSVPPTEDRLGGFGYPARERPFSCPQAIEVRADNGRGAALTREVTVTGIVDGIFREIDAKSLIVPLAKMQELVGTRDVSYYAVELRASTDPRAFIRDFSRLAADRNLAVRASQWQTHDVGDLYLRTVTVLRVYSTYVTLIMLLVTGLAISAVAMKLVGERTKEIGMLRSVGFLPRAIVVEFGLEALLTSVLGVAIGAVATLAFAALINALDIEYFVGGMTQASHFRLKYDPAIYAVTAVYLLTVGVGAVVLLVRKRTAMPVAENLLDPR